MAATQEYLLVNDGFRHTKAIMTQIIAGTGRLARPYASEPHLEISAA